MANDTTVKFRADISDLKAKMQAASRAVKVATSEFKAATAGMDDWAKSSEGLSAKLKQLDTVLTSQKQQLALSEQELEKTVKVYGENSAAADRVRIKINEQKAAIAQTEKQIEYYTKELDDCNKGLGKFAKEEEKTVTATDKLRKTIDEQQSELDQLKRKYADVVLEQGKGSKEAQELAGQIDKLSGDLRENKQALDQAENAADDFDKTLDEVDQSAKDAGEGFTVFKGILADLAANAIRECVRGLVELAKATFEAGSSFEAGMSKVQAISGANAQEMELLTAKAKEMGETTKFSATESAEAFNYMAMAGWKTEDMLDGIEGIMSLAAASGADLGTTSDIVTDALTAFGYTAKDAAHFSDVLAAASSNANTNVELMGESFKYAAPIAGSLGYSVEDVAVALGLMANSGIKGSMAGTSLRNVLQRMANPTKDVSAAMDRLGLSLDDGHGNMYSLMEIMEQLRDSFGEINIPIEEYDKRVELLDNALEDGTLTEKKYEEALEELNLETFGAEGAEKARAAAMLGGARALSGLLAITETSEEDFQKLTNAIDNSTGAAKNMADTMNDNVQGQITLLKSNVEGKMIRVFEKASGSIKKAVKSISNSLDKLDWDKIAKNVGKLAEKIADLIDYVVKNQDKVLGTISKIAKAIGGIFVLGKIGQFAGALTNLGGVFTALATKTGILTTVTNAAGEAQLAFNTALLANPATWIVGAVAAYTAWVIYDTEQTNKAIDAKWGLNDAQEELVNSINSEHDAMQSTVEERQKTVDSIATEWDYIRDLKDEYKDLVDSNGNVKEGYEDRVNFIKNQLSEALGIEMDQIDELINKNTKLGDGIDKLIQKKQAEATLSAYSQSYADAKANEKQYVEDVVHAQAEYLTAADKTKQAEDELAEATERYNQAVADADTGAQYYYEDVLNAQRAVNDAKDAQNDLAEALENANENYITAQTTIKNYEGLSSAIISNDSTKIQTELDNLTTGFQTYEGSTRESLENQVSNYRQYYEDVKAAMEAGNPVITQEMVDSAKEMVDKAETELLGAAPKIANAGLDASRQYCSSISSQSGEAGKSATTLAAGAESALDVQEPIIAQKGTKAATGYNTHISAQSRGAFSSGTALATSANSGMGSQQSIINTTGMMSGTNYTSGVRSKSSDAHSAGTELANNAKTGTESVDFVSSGENAGSGFVEGIGKWISSALEKGKELAAAALDGVKKKGKEGSPWKTTIQSGEWFGEGFEIGVQNTLKDVVKSATQVAAVAIEALDSTDGFYEAGEAGANNFVDGFKASIENIKTAISTPLSDLSISEGSASLTAGRLTSGLSGTGASQAAGKTQNVVFNQYNTSPKTLDRLTIYRDTNGLLFNAKVRLNNV